MQAPEQAISELLCWQNTMQLILHAVSLIGWTIYIYICYSYTTVSFSRRGTNSLGNLGSGDKVYDNKFLVHFAYIWLYRINSYIPLCPGILQTALVAREVKIRYGKQGSAQTSRQWLNWPLPSKIRPPPSEIWPVLFLHFSSIHLKIL